MCVVVTQARDRKKNTLLRVKRVIILMIQREIERCNTRARGKKSDLKEQSDEVYYQFYPLKDHLTFPI